MLDINNKKQIIIATWNINSINIRISNIIKLIHIFNIDIICLQEIKSIESKFPVNIFYNFGFYLLNLNTIISPSLIL